jgi:protein-disulfide isomerase
MFCIVSALVLSILGIFSASNRELAREAFDCVLRRVTFRPCNTGFDTKMKAKILGVVITRSEKAAAFLNKYFEAIAWVFFILFLASAIMFFRGLFLFYTTGSCNGVNSTAFCVFDPSGKNNQVSATAKCPAKKADGSVTSLKGVDVSSFPVLNPDAGNELVMIGCYHCEYTRKVYPEIRKLVDHFGVKWVYIQYPVKEDTDYFSELQYAVYKVAPDKYWQFNDLMFTGDMSQLDDPAHIQDILKQAGMDATKIDEVMKDPATASAVDAQITEINKTGFFGTPTVYIGKEFLVGPKPYRVYAIALEGLFYWLK